jgi:hypothetical protein
MCGQCYANQDSDVGLLISKDTDRQTDTYTHTLVEETVGQRSTMNPPATECPMNAFSDVLLQVNACFLPTGFE